MNDSILLKHVPLPLSLSHPFLEQDLQLKVHLPDVSAVLLLSYPANTLYLEYDWKKLMEVLKVSTNLVGLCKSFFPEGEEHSLNDKTLVKETVIPVLLGNLK